MGVRRVQEALFLVLLQHEHCEVQVQRGEADRKADGRVRLLLRDVTHVAEPLRVRAEGDEDEERGDEGQGEEQVEVDEAVEEVEVPRLGTVQLGAGAFDGEQVVLDDVERHEDELVVRRRVDKDDRELWSSGCAHEPQIRG